MYEIKVVLQSSVSEEKKNSVITTLTACFNFPDLALEWAKMIIAVEAKGGSQLENITLNKF